jgi:hypothetical protein
MPAVLPSPLLPRAPLSPACMGPLLLVWTDVAVPPELPAPLLLGCCSCNDKDGLLPLLLPVLAAPTGCSSLDWLLPACAACKPDSFDPAAAPLVAAADGSAKRKPDLSAPGAGAVFLLILLPFTAPTPAAAVPAAPGCCDPAADLLPCWSSLKRTLRDDPPPGRKTRAPLPDLLLLKDIRRCNPRLILPVHSSMCRQIRVLTTAGDAR